MSKKYLFSGIYGCDEGVDDLEFTYRASSAESVIAYLRKHPNDFFTRLLWQLYKVDDDGDDEEFIAKVDAYLTKNNISDSDILDAMDDTSVDGDSAFQFRLCCVDEDTIVDLE
jgi:hypothetical protein